jgi:hypothetical protein
MPDVLAVQRQSPTLDSDPRREIITMGAANVEPVKLDRVPEFGDRWSFVVDTPLAGDYFAESSRAQAIRTPTVSS